MAFYMKGSPFNNGKENRAANKLRRQERRNRAKEIKDSSVGADKYSFTGYESDMGKYDKKGRHKEFPEQRYSKKNPASNKAASDMMRTSYLGPLNQAKQMENKRAESYLTIQEIKDLKGTPQTPNEIAREEATNQLFDEGKITETDNKAYKKINRRVKKNKRKAIRKTRKSI
jgi:hypothetical protein